MKIILLLLCSILAFPAFPQSKSAKAKANDTTQPFVLGVVDALYSNELGERRVLNIYLPEGYDKSGDITYPVTYLLDGSANEDFIHVAGLYQYNSFDWINRVPKSIVVGIATVDRKRDFTYPTTIEADRKKYPTTGHSDRFMAFIEKELQPYIQKKYKTNGARTLIGQSLGGLLATEILLKKPFLFDKYVIISPSLWWDNGSLLQLPLPAGEELPKKTVVYIGVGKEGLTPTAIPRVMEVDANLLAEKIRDAVTLHFDYLPDEDHATIGHQAISNALKVIYAKMP